MSNRQRHTRKRRRLENARLRTGKTIVRHKLISGRTGQVHIKKLKSKLPIKKPPGDDGRL